jgi:hypothetical protein
MRYCDAIRSFSVAAQALVRVSIAFAEFAVGLTESAVSAATFGQEVRDPGPPSPHATRLDDTSSAGAARGSWASPLHPGLGCTPLGPIPRWGWLRR